MNMLTPFGFGPNRMEDMMDDFLTTGPFMGGQMGQLPRSSIVARPTWQIAGQPEKRSIVPRIDIVETDTCYCIYVDLVGATKDTLDVHVIDNQLSISADKQEDHEFEKMQSPVYITQERNKGRFNRLIRLPPGVKNETSVACFENGVLHLKFDKLKKSASQVQVKIK